jgi:hypothetical protein
MVAVDDRFIGNHLRFLLPHIIVGDLFGLLPSQVDLPRQTIPRY